MLAIRQARQDKHAAKLANEDKKEMNQRTKKEKLVTEMEAAGMYFFYQPYLVIYFYFEINIILLGI